MQDLYDWFALKQVPGIGNLLYKRLLAHFGTPQQVFEAPYDALLQVDGVSRRLANVIRRRPKPAGAADEIRRAAQKGFRIVTQLDTDYPALLHEIPDPPPYLYVYGRLPRNVPCIALVGSRNATDYGLTVTRRLARDLVQCGFVVVSGMARGIDTAAHEGALAGGGKTLAVLGSGLERIYPAENRRLYHQIGAHGAVLSELPLQAAPESHHFPARNRIISGLCLGTVIMEATRKSGSLITARLAAEQNREVFAVPGSIQSHKSTGTHTLIKQGAKLVEHARDILEEFSLGTPPPAADSRPHPPPADLSVEESAVWAALSAYPLHIDELARKTALAPAALAAALLTLEIKGLVRQSSGKMFTRNGS